MGKGGRARENGRDNFFIAVVIPSAHPMAAIMFGKPVVLSASRTLWIISSAAAPDVSASRV